MANCKGKGRKTGIKNEKVMRYLEKSLDLRCKFEEIKLKISKMIKKIINYQNKKKKDMNKFL